MINRRLNSVHVIRITALLALFGILAGLAPQRAGAATFEDGFYESTRFGFSITYDDTQWVGEELEGEDGNEGIALENALTWSNIRGVEREDMDEEACLEYMAEQFEDGETMRGFRRAPRSVEVPEAEIGGEAGLYSLEMGREEPVEFYTYLQCVAIADDTAALMIMMAVPQTAYDDALPTWNELLAGIEIGEPSDDEASAPDDARRDDEADTAGAGSYVAEEIGLTIEWDETVWTGTVFDDESGYGVEFDTEVSFGYVSPQAAEETTPEYCVEIMTSNLESSDAFKRVRAASSDYEPIEGDESGSFGLFTALMTESPDRVVFYLECRPTLDDEQMLLIYISTSATDYEDEHDAWQELIDGISIPDEAVSDSTDRDSERDGSSGEAGEFVGENFDFAVSYDAELWDAEVSTEDGYDWIGMSSDYGTIVVVAFESDVELVDCVDSLVSDEEQYAASEIEPAGRGYDLPATDRDAEGALYEYEANEDGGSGDVVVYFECRAIEEGESLVAVTFVTTPALYEDALPKFEAVLDTIEIG